MWGFANKKKQSAKETCHLNNSLWAIFLYFPQILMKSTVGY